MAPLVGVGVFGDIVRVTDWLFEIPRMDKKSGDVKGGWFVLDVPGLLVFWHQP